MNSKLKCILLVDDDHATNFLHRRMLQKMGAAENIQVVRNGKEAAEYLQKAADNVPGFPKPDLIFLDVNMPIANGWEFLNQYENLPAGFKNSIPVTMLSTAIEEQDEERAKMSPYVKNLLRKPLTEVKFRNIVEQQFEA